jgi:hypothetical protein
VVAGVVVPAAPVATAVLVVTAVPVAATVPVASTVPVATAVPVLSTVTVAVAVPVLSTVTVAVGVPVVSTVTVAVGVPVVSTVTVAVGVEVACNCGASGLSAKLTLCTERKMATIRVAVSKNRIVFVIVFMFLHPKFYGVSLKVSRRRLTMKSTFVVDLREIW